MILKVHCPGCQAALQVPERSSGRFARCPACKTLFKVPSPTALLEETVFTWIQSDVETEFKDRQNYWQEQIGSQLPRGASRSHAHAILGSQQLPTVSTPAPVPPIPTPLPPVPTPDQKEDDLGDLDLAILEQSITPPPPKEELPPEPPEVHPEHPAAPEAAKARPAQSTTTPAPSISQSPSITAPPHPPLPVIAPPVFPSQLHSPDGKPHLIVIECNQSGVKLAFDSACLNHVGFRCSMPTCSVFNGVSDTAQLYARPLAFIDRSGAMVRSAQEFETGYEQHLMPGWTCRDLINAMGILEHLSRPFCNPMPYYVDKHHRSLSLHCSTATRSDGGITAQVVIPRGEYALQWLERVNGVCGPEYELLANELALIRSETWVNLTEQIRQRITVWCQFQPREKFRQYFSDAEFGQCDAGLAGLVVTDQRLIYHKYHHSGALSLHAPGSLLLTRQEDLILLTHVDAEKRTRLIKLSPANLPQLLQTLGHLRLLKIVNQTT